MAASALGGVHVQGECPRVRHTQSQLRGGGVFAERGGAQR